MLTKQDKNFTVRLKAAIDKRMKESGVIDRMLEGSDHHEDFKDVFDRFMESLDDVTVNYLQGETRTIQLTAHPGA